MKLRKKRMPTQKKLKFVDSSKDLCETCSRAFKGGCPVWPTLSVTSQCVMYKGRGSHPSSKE